MGHLDETVAPVRTQAILVDPTTMGIRWLNDAAARAVLERGGDPLSATLQEAMPLAETLALSAAVRAVAETGEAQHLRADLVSMVRGSVALVVSVYSMPSGAILVLAENTWQVADRVRERTAARHHRTRGTG